MNIESTLTQITYQEGTYKDNKQSRRKVHGIKIMKRQSKESVKQSVMKKAYNLKG